MAPCSIKAASGRPSSSKASLTKGLERGSASHEPGLLAKHNLRTLVVDCHADSVYLRTADYILVPSIHACIAKGETPFRLGDGMNLWDVVYVGNVAFAHALAVRNLLSTKTAHGQAFFIQNNEPITFRDFCLAIWREFGHYPPFEVSLRQAPMHKVLKSSQD